MCLIETPRLLMRPFAIEDADLLLDLHRNPRVTRLITDTLFTQRDSAERSIRIWYRLQVHGLGVWHVSRKTDGLFIGAGALICSLPSWDVQFGGTFLPIGWGGGLAVEGGKALLDHGFGRLGLKQIHSFSHRDNRSAIRCLEALGFKRSARHPDTSEKQVCYLMSQEGWFTRD